MPGESRDFASGVPISESGMCMQGLGYQGEIGYQTFLYSSVKEWRKLLMFLLEKLPREAVQAADEPTG